MASRLHGHSPSTVLSLRLHSVLETCRSKDYCLEGAKAYAGRFPVKLVGTLSDLMTMLVTGSDTPQMRGYLRCHMSRVGKVSLTSTTLIPY